MLPFSLFLQPSSVPHKLLTQKKNKKAIEKQKELAQTFSKTGVASALILSSKMSVNAEGSTI